MDKTWSKGNQMLKIINKIAAIIVKDKKLLLVKKKDGDILISPGGMIKGDETPEETLKRELKEELDVEFVDKKPFGIFTDKATYEDANLIMYAYFVETKGDLKPKSEIEKFEWIGKDYKKKNIKVASVLEKFVIPKLIDMELM